MLTVVTVILCVVSTAYAQTGTVKIGQFCYTNGIIPCTQYPGMRVSCVDSLLKADGTGFCTPSQKGGEFVNNDGPSVPNPNCFNTLDPIIPNLFTTYFLKNNLVVTSQYVCPPTAVGSACNPYSTPSWCQAGLTCNAAAVANPDLMSYQHYDASCQ